MDDEKKETVDSLPDPSTEVKVVKPREVVTYRRAFNRNACKENIRRKNGDKKKKEDSNE